MNKNIILGNWEIIKGKIESKWGKLTNDLEIESIGDMDQLHGHLQKEYGWNEEGSKSHLEKLNRMQEVLEREERKIQEIKEEEKKKIKEIVSQTDEKLNDIFRD